jgi:CheY-like chemotaxis protein
MPGLGMFFAFSQMLTLWVDDHPENNVYECQAFKSVGLNLTLAQSTNDALEKMRQQKFAAVISDMKRQESEQEGYVLLDAMRQSGNNIPLFFYTDPSTPEYERETHEHGGQGCTNNALELFNMVTQTIITGNGNGKAPDN